MQVEPAVKDAASRVEPATKEATDGAIRPAGDYVSKNAVPVTKAIGENCARALEKTSCWRILLSAFQC